MDAAPPSGRNFSGLRDASVCHSHQWAEWLARMSLLDTWDVDSRVRIARQSGVHRGPSFLFSLRDPPLCEPIAEMRRAFSVGENKGGLRRSCRLRNRRGNVQITAECAVLARPVRAEGSYGRGTRWLGR